MSFLETINQNKTYIIAEIGINHNGSYDEAIKLIDLAVLAGCDCVKFQRRTIDQIASNDVMSQPNDRFPPEFGRTYQEVREFLEFSNKELHQLKDYSEQKGVDFVVTPFDIPALNELIEMGVQQIKIASHSVTNVPLIEALAERKITTILSSGMSTAEELDHAINLLKQGGCDLALLHCVSSYPTPFEKANLNLIKTLQETYNLPTGYSGHEIGFLPTIAAVAAGAQIVERHITMDRQNPFGPDHKVSVGPTEIFEMVNQIRQIEILKGESVKRLLPEEQMIRDRYRVSMTAKMDIKEGDTLTEDLIVYKNPGTGISPQDAQNYLGKTVSKSIKAGDLILSDDIKVA